MMAKAAFRLGDWVQATDVVLDDDVLVAERGDIGHVINEPQKAGEWPNIYFERTGRVSVCAPRELRWLGSAETGKTERRTESHGN